MNTVTPDSDIIIFGEKITGARFTDAQKKFLRAVASNHKQNLILAAPRGSGKTWLMSIVCAWYLANAQNYSVTIASGSRDQAARMMSWLHYFFSTSLRSHVKSKSHVARYNIYLAERNNKLTLIASSKQSRRGEHSNLLVIDEAESIEEEVLLDYLGIPTLEPSRILIVSTPDWTRTFSFFRSLFHGGEEYNYQVFRWTSDDAKTIPGWREAYEREKLKAKYNPAWFKTQWEADFAVEEGLVFKNLEKCIVKNRPEPVSGNPIRIGIDWGYTHNTVIAIAQLSGRKVNVLRTYAYQNVMFSAITKHLLTIYSEYEKYSGDIIIISDASAMGAEKTAELRSYGLNVVGVPFMNEKLSHLIPNAISWVESANINIYEGETRLIQQMANYYWETSESGKLKTKKIGDDYVDALLLALRDWRHLAVSSEPVEEFRTAAVSVYNFPETEEFLRKLRWETGEF